MCKDFGDSETNRNKTFKSLKSDILKKPLKIYIEIKNPNIQSNIHTDSYVDI